MKSPACTLYLVLPLLALTACGANRPFLQPVPGIRALSALDLPPPEDLNTTITFAQEKSTPEQLQRAVSTAASFKLPANAKIVISVPIDDKPTTASALAARVTHESRAITSFRTAGYFSLAEQQIERSLIEKGLTVLDRSRFEAKLRDQRVQAETPEASAPRQRRELIDIAELIRAAQKDEPKADFILQVNTFKTEPLSDRHIDLQSQSEIRYISSKNPGLEIAFTESGQTTITKPGYYGMLNAKLIEVTTGAIVWVGSHRVESLSILEGGFKVTVPVEKSVANLTGVQAVVDRYNSDLDQMQKQCIDLNRQLQDEDLDDEYYDALAKRYTDNCRKLNDLQTTGRPNSASLAWKYKYAVLPVTVIPELPTTAVLDRLEIDWDQASDAEEKARLMQRARRFKEFLTAHYSELAKLVTQELISTIPGQ